MYKMYKKCKKYNKYKKYNLEVYMEKESTDLLVRLRQYKWNTDATYKSVAIECHIPFSTFYGFTGGFRELKVRYALSLNEFLKKKGY